MNYNYFIEFIQKIGTILCLTIILLACDTEHEGITLLDEDTFQVSEQNAKINLAIEEAQESMIYFIEVFNKKIKDSNFSFLIKTKFEGVDAIEHMWVEPFDYNENTFRGILINEPRSANRHALGDTVLVFKTDIEDWSIDNETEGISKGSFTEKYLFPENP